MAKASYKSKNPANNPAKIRRVYGQGQQIWIALDDWLIKTAEHPVSILNWSPWWLPREYLNPTLGDKASKDGFCLFNVFKIVRALFATVVSLECTSIYSILTGTHDGFEPDIFNTFIGCLRQNSNHPRRFTLDPVRQKDTGSHGLFINLAIKAWPAPHHL